MGLTRLAINRPLTILMLILGMVIMGVVAWGQLRVDRMPNISYNFVSINVSYAGASPADMEKLVVIPIEQQISGLAGVASYSSNAGQGSASINLSLVEGANADKVAVDVQNRLGSIRSRLPADASAPSVNRADPNSQPIMNISLTGPQPVDELYLLATQILQPRLQSVLGVADISVSGGLDRGVNVAVDYSKLEAYGITVPQITAALGRENLNSPGGSVKDGNETLSIRAIGQYQNTADIENLVIVTSANGPVYLHDVATVTDSFKERTRIQRINGQEAVGLSITKQSDANSIAVSTSIRETLDQVQRLLPKNVGTVVTNDSTRFTRRALDAVYTDLGMAIVLTGLVLLLFLHSWRNVTIVILAIPTSLITTFLAMRALNFSLNTISLMALALMIGILVDDSIVVIENINRHLRLGEKPILAALNGRSEIGLAAIAITLTDVVVYVPVAMMQGNIGQLFREYGLTIASATLFSLFICFTLTPMLASRWLKNPDDGKGRGSFLGFGRLWEKGFDRVASGYGRVLGLGLRLRLLVVLVGLAAFGGAVAMIPLNLLGTEYAPQEDDSLFSVSVQLPVGSTLASADQTVGQIENMLTSQIPEITAMFTSINAGGGGGGFGGGRGASGNISVQLVDKSQRQRSVFDIVNVVRRIGTGFPGVTIRPQVSSTFGGGGGGGGIQVRITGNDLSQMLLVGEDVEIAMLTVPGITDVTQPNVAGSPEINVVFDRKRMLDMGVSGSQVANSIRTLTTGTTVGQLQPTIGSQRDIVLIGRDSDRLSLSNLANVPVPSSSGAPVRLGQVANIVRANGPTQISRTNGQRVITVSGTSSGRATGDIITDLKVAMEELNLPDGYSVAVAGGQAQMINVAFGALMGALGLSVILMYMLLVALYESFLEPLAIMFALPVSLVGAFGGLYFTNNTFNIFSMIGMIMLMGLVAKNGILLVDYTKTLRRQGLPRTEAIIQAGRIRLRPIVMTTMTIICAMFPLALKLEDGAESRSPMAVAVIGGVISSTLLTLLLVPAAYTYLDDLGGLLGRARLPVLRRQRQTRTKASPAPQVGGLATADLERRTLATGEEA